MAGAVPEWKHRPAHYASSRIDPQTCQHDWIKGAEHTITINFGPGGFGEIRTHPAECWLCGSLTEFPVNPVTT